MFVGATMPREGGKSVAEDLRRRFPAAVWLQGAELHHSKAGTTHEWAPLATPQDIVPAVVASIREQQAQDQGLGRTLVFCQDTGSVDAMCEALELVTSPCCLHAARLVVQCNACTNVWNWGPWKRHPVWEGSG
jgi:hypothetical protein